MVMVNIVGMLVCLIWLSGMVFYLDCVNCIVCKLKVRLSDFIVICVVIFMCCW